VRIFDSNAENPELIWSDGMRSELRAALEHLSDECLAAQRADPLTGFQVADTCRVDYPQLADELCIGGVYIRLLLEQPAWQLHNPRAFLEALLQAWAQMVQQDAPDVLLGQTSQALVVLLQANPALHVHVAATGYIPRVLAGLAAERNDLQRSCAQVLRQITESADCVHGMRSLDCVAPLGAAMAATPTLCDQLVPTLVALMAESDLVEKALEAKLVQFVLGLLSGGVEQCEDPSAVKAHAVRLLKKMASDPRCGPVVQGLLDEDRAWDAYKLQDHDLFLASESTAGLITHAGPRVGLLTQ